MDKSGKQMNSGLFTTTNAASLAAAMLFIAAQAGRCDSLVNGSFETGDFSGWTVSIPNGTSQYNNEGYPDPTSEPSGSAGVYSTWSPYPGVSTVVTPATGSYFAVIGSADTANFEGDLTYNITASQTVSLNAGQTVSGSALFYNGDYAAQDTASVQILNGSGQNVSTPWSETSGGTTYQGASAWSSWEWQAPSSGDYTIELGVNTMGDDDFASYGAFDGITVNSGSLIATEVPEPSSIGLFALGAAGFVGVRRRLKK
jgi:hypothetical protein